MANAHGSVRGMRHSLHLKEEVFPSLLFTCGLSLTVLKNRLLVIR